MADVTFTIAIQDDGTRVIRNIKREVDGLGTAAQQAGAKGSTGLSAIDRAAQGAGGALRDARGRFVALGGAADQASHSAGTLATTLSGIGRTAGLLGVVASATALVGLLTKAVTAGVQYNATLEQQQLGIASIVTATTDIADAQGKTLTGVEKFNAAQEISAALMKQIQADALKTTAISEQLVAAFQSAIGPLTAAGLSLTQSRDATLRIVQAASALGVPMEQVAQEVRAIAEGSIDVNARLAKTLNITNAQVTALKEQGKLYEFIVQKTEAFAVAGAKTEQSFSGLASSIADISAQILGLSTSTFFEQLKSQMRGLLSILTAVRETLNASGTSGLAKQIQDVSAQLQRTREHINYINDHPIQFEGAQAGAIEKTTTEVSRLEGKLKDLQVEWGLQQSAAGKTAGALDKYTTSVEKGATPASTALEKSIKEQIATFTKHGETLNLSGAALADWHAKQVIARGGSKELAEEMRKAVLIDEASKKAKDDHTKATQANTKAARDAVTEAKRLAREQAKLAQDLKDAALLQNKLTSQKIELDKKEADASYEALQAQQEALKVATEENALIAASLGPRENLLDLEKRIALAREERAKQTALTTRVEGGLTDAQIKLINATSDQTKANIELANSIEKHRLALQNAILTVNDAKDAFQDFITEALDDPGKALDSIEDFGRQLGGKLIAGIAFGKKGLEDDVLIPNFSDVFGEGGIVGQIFGQGGQSAGTGWASGFMKTVSSFFGSGSSSGGGQGIFSNVLGGSSSTAAGASAGKGWGEGFLSSISSLFGGAGGASSGGGMGIFSNVSGGSSSTAGAAAGSAYGDAFSYAAIVAAAVTAGKDFSKGKYGSGGGAIVGGVIGGYFGGAQGAAIGAQLGKFLGGFLDPLFKHIKTKGSQIRAHVKDYLKEIEASFAKEIDSSEYFFDQTKKLADKMFGGDFLAASKKVLTDKAGPAIAKQLQALGAAITAGKAGKLDKSLEQTATTFGNLLVKNLGIEKIPAAIAEIISKGDFTFENLTDKLTEVFEKKAVSAEFYIDTIQGAVDIFYGNLPEAIHVSELAMQSFDETGKFVLEKFTRLLEAAVSQMDVFSHSVGESLAQGIESRQTRDQVETSFENLFKEGLRSALIEKSITDTLVDLLKDIDLSKPIDLSSEAFANLKDKVGDAYDRLLDLLDAAGLLPEALENSVGSADDLVAKIRELQSAIQEIANQRIELRLQLLDDLASIGLITALDAIADRIQSIQDRITALIASAGQGHIGTQPLSELSDTDLTQLIALQGELRQAILSRYQEEAAAIQAAAQAQIAAIQADYAARREAIQADFAARKEAVRADFEARREAIRADFDARKAAIQADFDARKAAIQADFDARREAVQADFEARREAIEETISLLQEQRTAAQELYQEQIQGLEEQLRIAEQFGQVVQSITEMIRAAALSAQSPLAPQQQLGFLQREEAGIRGQLATATGAEQVRLTQELAQILQQQLQFVDRNTVNGQQLFRDIIAELNTLRTAAAKEADKAANLQARIAQATLTMEATLKSIDEQIEKQQELLSALSEQEQIELEALSKEEQAALEALSKQEQAALEALSKEEQAQLAALSGQEQAQLAALAAEEETLLTALAEQEAAAIAAVEKTAADQLSALRQETADQLTALAIQQDLALQEQLKRLEAQLDTAKDQLIAQVGVEEATKLLAAGDEASLILLAQANVTLHEINRNILQALNGNQNNNQSNSQTNSQLAAGSNSSQVFTTAAVPLLNVSQQSNATATPSSSSVNISFSPVVNVTVEPGGEGKAKQSVEEVMRLAEQRFGRKLETDWAQKIQRVARGGI